MISATALVERAGERAYRCLRYGWRPKEGVDGTGEPTYGTNGIPVVEWAGRYPRLAIATVEDTLASIMEIIAWGAATKAERWPERIIVHWWIGSNDFELDIDQFATRGSATRWISGERTGRIVRRSLNAAMVHEARRRASGGNA